MLFEVFDFPQWYHFFSSRRYFIHFFIFHVRPLLQIKSGLKSEQVLETATKSKKNSETIVEGQRLCTAHHGTHMFQSAFSREKNEENSDTDMYMPPLVHVRTLFFLFLLRLVSSLSSFVIFPLSFSVCLPMMLRWCCVWCVCVCVCWERERPCARSKSLPCLDSKRPRACGQYVRVLLVHTGTPHTPQPRPRTQPHTTQTTHDTDHTHNTPHRSKEKRRKRVKQREDERRRKRRRKRR